jgi:hypothetical protein
MRPPIKQPLVFARPLSQDEYEQQEGIIETPDGLQYFTVGDFLIRHRGKQYLVSKEHVEQEYCFVLGSRMGWACYRLLS